MLGLPVLASLLPTAEEVMNNLESQPARNVSSCEGFKMPAADGRCSAHGRPASENLQGRKPRDETRAVGQWVALLACWGDAVRCEAIATSATLST